MPLNKVMLIGNLGKKPEFKTTQGGNDVANFSMATTEKWKNPQGEKQQKTEWHNIVCWKQLARLSKDFLDKGSSIFLEGKLQTRSWEDKDGNKRYTTEIVATQIQFLDRKKTSSNSEFNSEQSELPF